MDPAGSIDDEYEYIDLCDKHTWEAYKAAEKEYGYKLGKSVYDAMMRRVDRKAA